MSVEPHQPKDSSRATELTTGFIFTMHLYSALGAGVIILRAIYVVALSIGISDILLNCIICTILTPRWGSRISRPAEAFNFQVKMFPFLSFR